MARDGWAGDTFCLTLCGSLGMILLTNGDSCGGAAQGKVWNPPSPYSREDLGLIWARCAPLRGTDNQLLSISNSERCIYFLEAYVKQLGLENGGALPRTAA